MQSPSLDASDAILFARAIIESHSQAEGLSIPAQRILNMARVLVSYEEQQTRLAEDPS